MYRFYAVDWFNGHRQVIYRSNNLQECYEAILQRFTDTCAECGCEIEDTLTNNSFNVRVIGSHCEEDE